MSDRGWAVVGVEPDARAADQARAKAGIRVYATLAELQSTTERFDAITLSHVLEHVSDPIATLRDCWGMLNVSGRLVVLTPNVKSLGHVWFKGDWRGLEPPRHLFLFSPTTLSVVATRAGIAGFGVRASAKGATYMWRESLRIRRNRQNATNFDWLAAIAFFALQGVAGSRHGEELLFICDRSPTTGKPDIG